MADPKKPTIYDIAAEARVSPSSIAAVLNGSWQKRRIGAETARTVLAIAQRMGYSANLQARGLRNSRSGLLAMIVPMLDNRFFSTLAEAFEGLARAQGLYPVVVSTFRDPTAERETVATLIAHNVDGLFLAGATDPDRLSDICALAGVRHVNVDLPGTKAHSVISDNAGGAHMLTVALLRSMGTERGSLHFIGGIASDHNTASRIGAFRTAAREGGRHVTDDEVHTCGYDAKLAEAAIGTLHARIQRLPDGLFVNSTIAFEGVARFLRTLPPEEVRACAIGCFDWDPYIEMLPFPVPMIRQDVVRLVAEAHGLLSLGCGPARPGPGQVYEVPTMFVPAAGAIVVQ